MGTTKGDQPRTANVRNDIVALGVVLVATGLFLGIGGRALTDVFGPLSGPDFASNPTLFVALVLDVALILFAWRRYRDLTVEVAERTAAEARAQALALRDPLTGLLNRRALAEEGAGLIQRSARRQKPVALLTFDLDHFKTINDLHGHAAGDVLLKAVADAIVRLAPPSALTARLGGDEFACLFAFDTSNPEVIDTVAQDVVSRLAQPFEIEGLHMHISVSCGISRLAADCVDMDGLMRRGDIAMYAAKRAGRNRPCWFDASMERELRERNALEMAMRAGLTRGEFVPYFEQQIDLRSGRLQGFEMLARWEHPTQGTISPEVFIPIAEETGMIADLSLCVIRAALAEARNWDPSLTLSVNISPTQLKDGWLAQKLVKILAETGFPAHRLEVEITESSLFDNLALAQSIVGSLKNQGIRLALDDFGTGYSSLAHLRALPFDRIKIDKSFVASILTDRENAAIVAAVAMLGDGLGMPVTAEGIEDAETEARLRDLGCGKAQGWLYGRPTSIQRTRTLLAARNLLPSARLPAPTVVERDIAA